jgi:hypothetical protein
MKTCLGIALVLVMTCTAWADIEVKPQYNANEQIVVKVLATSVPEGAKLRGSFQVTGATWDMVSVQNVAELRAAASGLKSIMTSVPVEAQPAIKTAIDEMDKATSGETFHVWAGAGRHTITASGVWVMTKTVTVGTETFDVLIDFGQYNYVKDFVVGPEVPPGPFPDPDPNPDPDPKPDPSLRRVVILEETKDRTAEFGLLRQLLIREFLPDRLQILDDDLPAASAYLPMAVDKDKKPLALPVLLVLQGDKLVRAVACPSTVDGVRQEVAR